MTTPTDPPAPGLLHRTGRWCARRGVLVLTLWLLALAALAAGNRAWGGTFADDFALPGTSAQTGADLLAAHGSPGTTANVVLHTGHGPLADHRAPLDAALAGLRALPDVLDAADPLTAPGALSADGATATVAVRFTRNPATFDPSYLAGLDRAVAPLRADGVAVEYADPLGQLAKPKGADRTSELIGLGTAVLVLLIGFGSVVATGLPLVTGVLGVAAGLSALGLLATGVDFGRAAPTLAVMMGLGVGVDYALFLTTRHRALLPGEPDPAEAAGRAVATSGRAVLVAAATVAMALAGLYASGVSFIGSLGAAAGVTVVVAATSALTLTPALLGLFGRRVDCWYVRRPVAEGPAGADNAHGDSESRVEGADPWHRWAAVVGRHPWRCLTAGVLLLGALCVPAAGLRLGHVDAGAQPASRTERRAYDLVTDGFGAGANGRLTVVVQLDAAHAQNPDRRAELASALGSALAATPGAASAGPPRPSSDGALLVSTVTPATGPQERATSDLLHRLQDDTLPTTLAGTGTTGYVTGTTAAQLAFRDVLARRLPLIVAVVVGAAFLLLLTVFRSPVIAVKAALLNLLSIGAAYGVVVAVFQWGLGGRLLGVARPVPVESYVPMMMFAIVFGLSMDYEVFLLSRIREHWLEHRDNHRAVAAGLASTARVIGCAALIMTSVFLAFLLSTDVVIKMMALGLGVSVVLDATVVRLLLVPATMYLLGRANWWMPAWLDRLLPRLDPEGTAR